MRSQAVPAQRTVNNLVHPKENFREDSLQRANTTAPSLHASRDASPDKNPALRKDELPDSPELKNFFLTPPISRPPVSLLGVPFDHVTAASCLQWMDNAIASGRPHYVVTANVDFLVQARFDVELRRILLDAHLVICDGTPLLWASRLQGNPLPERVAGADVVPELIQRAAQRGYRLFFLGATVDACNRAVESLQSLYPGLKIAGHYSPPFNKLLEMDHDEITRRVREAKPDLLFVCFGCPKQEKWMAMHYRSLGVPVSIGLGATIDFLAGQVKRAPQWMRRTGLEWTFRLAQEPRRLFWRYFKDLWVFASAITSQWSNLQLRRRGKNKVKARYGNQQPRFWPLPGSPTWQRYKLPPCIDFQTVDSTLLELDAILNDPRHCLFDVSEVKFIDSTGLGMIARLHQKLSSFGRQLVLIAPTPAVTRALRIVRLREFITCACDVPTALQIIDSRVREATAAATPRTAASSNVLAWQGEITAANAETVWKFTHQHISLLCPAWKAGPATNGNANNDGNGSANGHELSTSQTAFDALKLRILNPPSILAPRKFTIDLSNVRFIDSTGLGLMVRAKKLAVSRGAQLTFTGLQPAVRNVLRIARMEDHLLS